MRRAFSTIASASTRKNLADFCKNSISNTSTSVPIAAARTSIPQQPQPRRFFFTTKMTATSTASNGADALKGKPELFSIGKLNHVAIAVPDLSKATSFYRDIMGAQVSEPLAQPDHGVTVVFVNLPNTKIELLHPLNDGDKKSPIENFLQKNASGGIHHVCLEVEDIHVALQQVKSKGIRPLNPEPKIGAHGKPVVFLHPKDCNGVLVELEQV